MQHIRIIVLFAILPAFSLTIVPHSAVGQETADSAKVDLDFCAMFGCGPSEPELIGGLEALQSLIRYPEQAKQVGVEGRIVVVVTIDTTGIPRDPVVLRRLVIKGGTRLVEENIPQGAFGFEAEALRVAGLVRFVPARHVDGRRFEQKMALPVMFRSLMKQ